MSEQLTPRQIDVVGEWFTKHHGHPCARETLADLERMLTEEPEDLSSAVNDDHGLFD